MPNFHFNYRRRDYYIDAPDRSAAYKLMLKEAAARTAKLAAEKAAKLAHTMTCQCCGRAIFAETGMIAHHGYQRPGAGWQTASCFGARHVPFEVSRDTLGLMLTRLREELARDVEYRAAVAAETMPCRVTVEDRSKPKEWGRGYPDMTVDVARASYADFRKAHEREVICRSMHSFEVIKERYISGLDAEIRSLTQLINDQQNRFDGWKQTHEWKDQWVKL